MKKIISILAGILVFCFILFISEKTAPQALEVTNTKKDEETPPQASLNAGSFWWWKLIASSQAEPVPQDAGRPLYAGTELTWKRVFTREENEAMIEAARIKEYQVYSFLQGPRSWEEGITWSGEWCYFNQRRNYFGNFGCGLCCMANIYDTMSPYEVSPWDMLELAKEIADYAPSEGNGAIGWKMMRKVLSYCGVKCVLLRKPSSYETFQKQMRYAKSAVILVCSSNDDTYWEHTGGHYVNIWMYDEESDTVFVAEPGSPERNRSRISLRYVYDAQKTVSEYQYLLVEGYSEDVNEWKGDGIEESWNRP